MRTWKRTYLLPGVLLSKTSGPRYSNDDDQQISPLAKNTVVMFLGIKIVDKNLGQAWFLARDKLLVQQVYHEAVKQVLEAWIKSNFAPLTNEN